MVTPAWMIFSTWASPWSRDLCGVGVGGCVVRVWGYAVEGGEYVVKGEGVCGEGVGGCDGERTTHVLLLCCTTYLQRDGSQKG